MPHSVKMLITLDFCLVVEILQSERYKKEENQ